MRLGAVLTVVLLLPAVAFLGCKNKEVEALEREVLAQQGETVAAGDEAGEPVVDDQPSGEVLAEELGAELEVAPDTATVSRAAVTALDPGVVPDAGAIPPEAVPNPVQELTGVKELPARPTGSGYEVQISAGTDSEDAAFVVRTFQQRGYEPYVSATEVGGRAVYRVRVGVYATYGEAERVRQELAQKYSIEPWIAPVP